MSENFCQKKGSNQAKTKKESENTNEIVDFSAEGSDPTSFQWEIATKKNKKKRVKNQKNESSIAAIDESKFNDQGVVVDGSEDLKIGDFICVENQNEKPTEKKNLHFEKKEALNSNSFDNIIVSNEVNEYNNDFPILEANDVTKVLGTNKKTLKKKRRLENAKENNELEASCPEIVIKNVKSEITVDSSGLKEENEISALKESEEKPKKRRRRKNTKSKSALESCSSGKLIKESVESIITEANSDHDNKEKTEDKNLPTDSNGESRYNTNKTVETVYRAPIKRKRSANLDEETKDILEKVPSSVVIDSKQAMGIENSGSGSTSSKRRKRNKNKSKNEELSENAGEKVGNKGSHIEGKKESEHSLPEQNRSKLSEEIEEDLKIFQDNCKILDKKIKSKQRKTNTSISALPIKTDQNCTNQNQFSPPSSPSLTTTTPIEIKPPAEKLGSLKQGDKKCKKSKSKNKQPVSIESFDSKDEQTQLVVDENLETKKEVTLIAKQMKIRSYEKSMKNRSDQELHVKLEENQHEQKIHKSRKTHHDSVVVETSNKQSNVKLTKIGGQNRLKDHLFTENDTHQKLKSVENMEQGDDTLLVEKIERGQKNAKVEEKPARVSDNRNNSPQSELDKSGVNNNFELTKEGLGKTSKRGSCHDLNSEVAQDLESQLEKLDNTNIQQDDSKKKKSKSKKKKNSIQQVETTDNAEIDEGKKSQPSLGTNAETNEIIGISSEETTSTVEIMNTKKLVSENDKSKKCVSFCSVPILFNDVVNLEEQENRNGMSSKILEKGKKVEQIIDDKIDSSVPETDNFSSLNSAALISSHNNKNLESHQRNSGLDLNNSEATNNNTTNTTLQHFNFSGMQKYDLFAISEAEKRFAKLLESEYNFSSHNTTELNIDSQNNNYRNTTDPGIDSSNDYYAKTTESHIDLSNHYTKYTESVDSIFENLSNSTDDHLIINHFEDRDEEIPEKVRASNSDLQVFSDTNSNCNEKSPDRKFTLSWSQVAAKETKTKSEVSQDHSTSENQQKNTESLLESSKPVCIIVADSRPSRADPDIAAVDSEGFVKYVSKREMRKQRSRTSSRNDEQEVSQAIEEIQKETSIPVVKKSDSKDRVMSESANESNSLIEDEAVRFIFETGVWTDKWKYHDAEVEFFENEVKIIHSPASEILQTPTSDNDVNGYSSASEPPSPTSGKKRRSRRGRKTKMKKEMLCEADDSNNYTSDEDPMNLNSHVDATTPDGDSQSVNKQDNRIENDISNENSDSHVSNTTPNSSQKIKQLFVMILMELYFMLMYYASGLKKRKKVE